MQRQAKRKQKCQCQTKQIQGQTCQTRQRILCDNKRCSPQRSCNSHKTLYNKQHSRQLHKTKLLTTRREFENIYIPIVESSTIFISEAGKPNRF